MNACAFYDASCKKKKKYLDFLAVHFDCSYCKIYTDRRPLSRSEETFRESFNQACLSDIRISNQDNFKQVTVVVHFAGDDVRRLKTSTICEL